MKSTARLLPPTLSLAFGISFACLCAAPPAGRHAGAIFVLLGAYVCTGILLIAAKSYASPSLLAYRDGLMQAR